MSSLPLNQHFAVSDVSIAVAKDGPDTHSMIYIYPLASNQHEKIKELQMYDFKTDDPTTIKKLRYSGQPMDVTYSSRYFSLSKDGRYLAISWVPNPRLGINQAMKYCTIYDLNKLEFNGGTSDNEIYLEIPCAMLEFCGGCSFTNDRLVLINDSEALVHSIGDSFDLDFSLKISANRFNSNDGAPCYNIFPFCLSDDPLEKEVTARLRSTNIKSNTEENYDDIFFDSGDECPSDLEEEEDDYDMIENSDAMSIPEERNTLSSYQLFIQNNHFIKSNIESIKNFGMICHTLPIPATDDNNVEGQQWIAWSLVERCSVFAKKLVNGKLGYIHAFTKQGNLVALSEKHNLADTTHEFMGGEDSPLATMFDCASGVLVAKFSLPQERKLLGVRQILFLQNDNYLLTISHSREHIYFDLWDVLSAVHLDTCVLKANEEHLCMDLSTFVLNDQLQLTSGCGAYIQVEYRSSHDAVEGNMISDSHFNLSVRKIAFWEDELNQRIIHGCHCGKAVFWTFASESMASPVTLRDLSAGNILKARTFRTDLLEREAFFFLDQQHTHIAVCCWDPSNIGTHLLAMTIWEVSTHDMNELSCETFSQKHDLFIRFREQRYCFLLNRNEFIRDQTGMMGHPTLFLDMKAIRKHCIEHLSMRMVNAASPVLLLQVNHYNSTNMLLGFYKSNEEVKRKAFTTAVPIHPFSLLESLLHTLACQKVLPVIKRTGEQGGYFKFDSYARFVNCLSKDYRFNESENRYPRGHAGADLIIRDRLLELIRPNTNYFSTLGGYVILCRLARNQKHYGILCEILKYTTRVHYCTLSDCTNYQMDPLQEALLNGAIKNARLIVKHISHSVATYGVDYGYLLLKHRQLLITNDILVDH